MLLVNDVRLTFQTSDCSPLVLRLNEYCLLPFSTQMGDPGSTGAAHGFVYVLVGINRGNDVVRDVPLCISHSDQR